jgi:hypothetical protein
VAVTLALQRFFTSEVNHPGAWHADL